MRAAAAAAAPSSAAPTSIVINNDDNGMEAVTTCTHRINSRVNDALCDYGTKRDLAAPAFSDIDCGRSKSRTADVAAAAAAAAYRLTQSVTKCALRASCFTLPVRKSQ